MADQKRIKLYSLHATPKNVVMRELPVANASAATKIYLYTTHATPKNVVMRDPTSAPIPAGDTVNGALGATLGALTLSSAGQVTIDGDLVATLGTLTLSSAGQVVIDGDLVPTLGALTLSSAGQLVIDGDLAATLADLTAGSAGKVEIAAAEGTTLGALTLSAAGTVELAAALSATLASLTLTSESAISGEGISEVDRGDAVWRPKRDKRRARSQRRNENYLALLASREIRETPDKPEDATPEPITAKVVRAAIKELPPGMWSPQMAREALPKVVYVSPLIQPSQAVLAAAVAEWLRAEAQRMDDEDIEMLLLAA